MKAQTGATVAVVIPTYNHAHFLGAAIESVLTQTRPVDEILVIDDGSTDNPEQVTTAYPQVRNVRQANAGLAAARNRGMSETRAEFLLFLDADDRLKPETVALSLEILNAHPDAAFSYGGYELVFADGERRRATFYPVPENAFGAFLEMNPVGMHGTVLYRREALEEAGGFDPAMRACEDYDLYLRIVRDRTVVCRGDVMAEYWHHGGNMSHDPAFMLRWTLAAMEARHADAKAAGLLRQFENGRKWTFEFYVGVWVGQLKQASATALVLRRGLALARLAPGVMAAAGFRKMAGHAIWTGKRLARRIRGHDG